MEENTSTQAAPKKSFNPIWVIVVIVLLIGAGALLLSNSKKNQAPAMSNESPTSAVNSQVSPTKAMKTEATPSGAMTAGKIEEITVHGSNFAFSPSTVTVKKGDTVKLTFVIDNGFHDFVLNDFNVKTDTISTGKSATVTFTADKIGSFEYYCSVANHRAMGMKGTLIVQ